MARYTKQGQLLHDVTVRFQVYLERLKAGEARKMDVTIRALDKAIQAALAEVGDAPSQRKLDAALVKLRGKMEKLNRAQTETYLSTLKAFAKYARDYNVATINLIAPATSPALSPASLASWAATLHSPIQATGDLMEPFLRSWGLSAIRKVEGAIRIGYAQGLTTAQIVRLVRGTKAAQFQDGILGGVVKREADAMVRTALQHVSSQAAQAVMDDNASLIEGYIWISTLDSRTSQQCRSLDGEFFVSGAGPIPPIHINCRSATIPKLRGIDLLSQVKRASKGASGGKQVAASLSYYEWLKTQPSSFQDDALGKTRAILFRKGGLSAEKFARLNLGKNFEPLTLEEMRKKSPIVFERAGL